MNLPAWYHKWWGMKNADVASSVQPGQLPIALDGSLQNPAWSPDGTKIVFTRFRNGYNKGPADVYIYDIATKELRAIADDGSDNVSQPGSTWNNLTGEIVFSSDRDKHDGIWAARETGAARKITSQATRVAYEPSWSPDGKSVVFESHKVDQEGNGRIAILAGGQYVFLTSAEADCRQPNWSPRGDLIVYQSRVGKRWELFTYNLATKAHYVLTGVLPGDKTDATFSPDGQRILYSGTSASGSDGLMTIPVAGGKPSTVNHGPGYWGAASWSPDGKWIAAETSPSDPDGGPGTKIGILAVEHM